MKYIKTKKEMQVMYEKAYFIITGGGRQGSITIYGATETGKIFILELLGESGMGIIKFLRGFEPEVEKIEKIVKEEKNALMIEYEKNNLKDMFEKIKEKLRQEKLVVTL